MWFYDHPVQTEQQELTTTLDKSWQKADKKLTKAHPFSRRKPSSSLVWPTKTPKREMRHFPFWRIRLCSSYGPLSQCEFASWGCRRLCLHSVQLEDAPQFLAIRAFFLCMILTGAGYSLCPTFQVTGGFLCATKLIRKFWMCLIELWHDC